MKNIYNLFGFLSKKILFIISAILLITNCLFFSLFMSEHRETKRLMLIVMERQENIYTPTPPSPDKPQAEPKPVETPPAKPQVAIATTEKGPEITPTVAPTVFNQNSIPSALVHANNGEYALLCEKDSKMLYLFSFRDGVFNVVKGFPCLTGENHGDKQKPGDKATPEGVYFFLRFIPGKTLPKQYGFGAFVMNYPNFLARKEGKQGNGIWLHGHDPEKNIGKDIVNTKGCIVVDNKDLEEISRLIKPRGTPIIVVGKAQTADKTKQTLLSKEIKHFLDNWKHDWESLNTKKYLNHYTNDFISGERMDYAAFKQQKERVNRYKKFIKISIDEPAFLIPQEYSGKIAVVRFHQRYVSDNFKSESSKIFYLRKEQKKWHIIGESLF